jgi:signal transduction histidine kinase
MTHSVTTPSADASARRDRQLRDLRFLETLQDVLAGCRDELALYGSAVHRVVQGLDVESACLAGYDAIDGSVEILRTAGAKRTWDSNLLQRAATDRRTLTHEDVLAVPLVSSDGACVWAVLAVARSDTAPAFTSADRQTLRAVAKRVSSEIERRRDLLLDDVLDGLLRKKKPIDVYMHALREVRRFVRYDHSASIMTMQPGTAQLVVRAEKIVGSRGNKETLSDSPRRGRDLRLTPAQASFLLQQTGPFELQRDDRGWRLAGSQPGGAGLWRVLCLGPDDAAVLCYPLVFGGQMLGLLRVGAKRREAFAAGDGYRRVLERFARLLAVTLYRSELYHQSDRQLQAIKEIGRTITEAISVEEICRQVLHLALRVLHVEVGCVGLLNEEGELELVAHAGSTLDALPVLEIGQGVAGAVVQSGRSHAVPDVTADPGYVVFNARVRSELAAPIIYNREVIGFLDVESYEAGRFREEDEEVMSFLEALANQAAIAIKTAQLRSEAVKHLGPAMSIDPTLSTAGWQDLLIDELRDKIEKLATANRAKSDFLARMSHDLRGPLNVIVGLANLLTDPDVAPSLEPEKQRESLQVIRSSGDVLSALIGNILDLSALEAGKVELTVGPVDTAAAFAYLQTMGARLAEEYSRPLTIEVDVDIAVAAISVDEEKFLRIVMNLISNAVKFTPPLGTIMVRAFAEPVDGETQGLHVTVADTGVGIPPEHREAIFEPFRRLEGNGHKGTGLGLAVVRQLVELHGGRVWVESGPAGGSAFHVVLPHALSIPTGAVVDDAVPPVATEGPAATPVSEVRSKGLVLVVEDEQAHMDLMRLAVTSRGYTVHGVQSGEGALEWLAEHRPDVILLDMQLPGIDGFSVAVEVKGQIRTHSIPLIAVTASALSDSEERARASGVDAYLTKPIDIARLLATIDAVTT